MAIVSLILLIQLQAPQDIKLQKKKFEPKIMIWITIFSTGVSDGYVHRSNQAVRQTTYLDEYNFFLLLKNIFELEIISGQIW